MRRLGWLIPGLACLCGLAAPAGAQPLGTFRWQLHPYCNIVAVSVTQVAGVYRLEGTDDQCGGGAPRASVVGTAFLNDDGSVGIGLNVVTSPDGRPLPVYAAVSLSTLNGTWRDGVGQTGSFTFTHGAGTAGSPRPVPPPAVIPTVIRLQDDGGLVAGVEGDGIIPASGAGTRLMWYPGKAAFRAGSVSGTQWDDANTGFHSTALGSSTTASGQFATALGRSTIASGDLSLATGENTIASGVASTAMGSMTRASGLFGTALGRSTEASGRESFAAGFRVIAGGEGSVVLGSDATAQPAAVGTFLFADRSTTSAFTGTAPNEFGVRAAGGVYFYTRADLGTGVALAANGSSWAPLSDANMKENFRDVAGEEVLAKLARMPIQEWNYKAQDATIRHMGPTAQDFRAAFGLGDFPLRINTIDADGVALAGVKALEARTRDQGSRLDALARDNDALRERNGALARENEALRDRLDRLERLLDRR